METSHITTEIHPNFISIRIKTKLLQIKLWEEVKTLPIEQKRSTTTGQLYIKLEKINYNQILAKNIDKEKAIIK